MAHPLLIKTERRTPFKIVFTLSSRSSLNIFSSVIPRYFLCALT